MSPMLLFSKWMPFFTKNDAIPVYTRSIDPNL